MAGRLSATHTNGLESPFSTGPCPLPVRRCPVLTPHAHPRRLPRLCHRHRAPASLTLRSGSALQTDSFSPLPFLLIPAAAPTHLDASPSHFDSQVVGNFARLPAKTLNIVAGVFLASRVVFSAVYYLQRTEAQAWIRSGAFFSGIGASLYVLFSSASKVRARARGFSWQALPTVASLTLSSVSRLLAGPQAHLVLRCRGSTLDCCRPVPSPLGTAHRRPSRRLAPVPSIFTIA